MDQQSLRARRIVVIGFGSIAEEIVNTLRAAEASKYQMLVWLREGSQSLPRVPEDVAICTSAAGVAEFAPDLVVEAAGHSAVREHVSACLMLGLPVLISSIGALHDEALMADLVEKAKAHGGRLLLASGALGALDYVRSVRSASRLALTYESRKPPDAWKGELCALGYNPGTLAGPVTLFEGSARQAAAAYPQNLNVAAALALAGPYFEDTRVRVVCDPEAQGNTHVVNAESELGTMQIAIVNIPSPKNPKSSWIVVRSLLAAIEQHFSPVVML